MISYSQVGMHLSLLKQSKKRSPLPLSDRIVGLGEKNEKSWNSGSLFGNLLESLHPTEHLGVWSLWIQCIFWGILPEKVLKYWSSIPRCIFNEFYLQKKAGLHILGQNSILHPALLPKIPTQTPSLRCFI